MAERKTKKTSRLNGEFLSILIYLKPIIFKGPDDDDSEDDVADIDLELRNTCDFNGEEEIVKNVQGDPTDGGDASRPCVERWKANADDSKKGMFCNVLSTGI